MRRPQTLGKAFKAIKRKLNQPKVVKMEDYIKDPDMLKDLKDPANQVPLNTVGTNLENFSPKGDVSRLDPSFMGKNQMDNFQSLTDPLAVDRAGRAKSSQELDPVGIKPAMNPPFATPIDIDQQGINSLYSNEF